MVDLTKKEGILDEGGNVRKPYDNTVKVPEKEQKHDAYDILQDILPDLDGDETAKENRHEGPAGIGLVKHGAQTAGHGGNFYDKDKIAMAGLAAAAIIGGESPAPAIPQKVAAGMQHHASTHPAAGLHHSGGDSSHHGSHGSGHLKKHEGQVQNQHIPSPHLAGGLSAKHLKKLAKRKKTSEKRLKKCKCSNKEEKHRERQRNKQANKQKKKEKKMAKKMAKKAEQGKEHKDKKDKKHKKSSSSSSLSSYGSNSFSLSAATSACSQCKKK